MSLLPPGPDRDLLAEIAVPATVALALALDAHPAEALARHLLDADHGGDRGIGQAEAVLRLAGARPEEARTRVAALRRVLFS